MITRLEAIRYRCFERLGIDVGGFQVVVGANGAGKTTLLDLPVLVGDLLRSTNVGTPFMEGQAGKPPRAGNLNELVFAGRGTDFSLALEAVLPEDIANDVRNGAITRLKTEKSRAAFAADEQRWPTHVRYEISFELVLGGALQVRNEYLFLFPRAFSPKRSTIELHGAQAEYKKNWVVVLKRDSRSGTELYPEAPTRRQRISGTSDLPPTVLALPRVLYESSTEYPAARWLYNLLSADAVFLDPNWAEMRLASPPGQPKTVIASAGNVPWLALDLMRAGALKTSGREYRSERYMDWIAHVQTALPQIADIDVREREDDHHTYFRVYFRGGFNVPQSALSDGTLRILTLTLAPYLATRPAVLITEEPENGIHPRAIETVLQSLSSLRGSQVWVSSHSPVVLGSVDIDQLLCARLSSEGGVQIVAGRDHPRLMEWRRGIDLDLGTLFAAEVLN
jgi:predicted ATPase